MSADALLYLLVFVSLTYLIYRYARYSPWCTTDAGRAFMTMQVSLFALVCFGLGTVIDPDGAWRPLTRLLIVGGVWLAIMFEIRVVVRWQGGFRRRRRVVLSVVDAEHH